MEQFFARAKRTAKIFDQVEAVLSMKLLSPGCTLVTLRLGKKWYISTPESVKLLLFCVFKKFKSRQTDKQTDQHGDLIELCDRDFG